MSPTVKQLENYATYLCKFGGFVVPPPLMLLRSVPGLRSILSEPFIGHGLVSSVTCLIRLLFRSRTSNAGHFSILGFS